MPFFLLGSILALLIVLWLNHAIYGNGITLRPFAYLLLASSVIGVFLVGFSWVLLSFLPFSYICGFMFIAGLTDSLVFRKSESVSRIKILHRLNRVILITLTGVWTFLIMNYLTETNLWYILSLYWFLIPAFIFGTITMMKASSRVAESKYPIKKIASEIIEVVRNEVRKVEETINVVAFQNGPGSSDFVLGRFRLAHK